MFINGIPISRYGGVMLGTPRVSNAEYTSEYKYMRTRSTIRHLSHELGLKSLEVHIGFIGGDIHEIQMKRSALRAALIGPLDLSFSRDRFMYFAEYDGSADLESEYEGAAVSKFNFKAVQHLPLETVSGTSVLCQSTIPETDCKLTATATSAGTDIVLGPVTFPSVAENDILVADGITGAITKNGIAVTANFIRLPYLAAGENTIEASTNLSGISVQYYPTFV